MRKFAILTDSCSDLSKELREKFDIDYVKNIIAINGKEFPVSLDWEYFSAKEYYDMMRKGVKTKSTQVPQKDFYDYFLKCAQEGIDVLYVGCSSALSGSVNAAKIMKEDILEEYPNIKIEIVDCLVSSFGEGLQAIKAAELRAEGKTIEEVRDYLLENRLKFLQYGSVETLEYLRRAGRVKATAAFFGNIFSVKPIIISDIKGQNYAYKKVKGRRASILEIIKQVKENIVNPENQYIGIGHADCLEDAEFIKEQLEKEINVKGFYINNINPAVGASVGPGMFGVYFVGKEVTVEANN